MHARVRVTRLSEQRGFLRRLRRGGLAVAVCLTAVCGAAGSSPAPAGTIYWDMQTLAPTSNGVAGPTAYALRSSLDGYATDVAGATGSLPTTSTWAYYTNDLTTPLSIVSGSSVELRIYGWGGSAANLNNLTWRLDDLQLVVLPEPAAAMLAAGAVLGCVGDLWCRSRLRRLNPPSRT